MKWPTETVKKPSFCGAGVIRYSQRELEDKELCLTDFILGRSRIIANFIFGWSYMPGIPICQTPVERPAVRSAEQPSERFRNTSYKTAVFYPSQVRRSGNHRRRTRISFDTRRKGITEQPC